VGEEVGVVLAVGGQDLRGQLEDRPGLADVAEGGGGAGVQLLEAEAELPQQRVPGPRHAAPREVPESLVELALPARLGAAVGEVQVADQGLGEGRVELCVTIFHRLHLLRIVPVYMQDTCAAAISPGTMSRGGARRLYRRPARDALAACDRLMRAGHS